MSSKPSPSKSKTAAPEPTICGMKCLAWSIGPASWTKSSPTFSVTSSNQGGRATCGTPAGSLPQPSGRRLSTRTRAQCGVRHGEGRRRPGRHVCFMGTPASAFRGGKGDTEQYNGQANADTRKENCPSAACSPLPGAQTRSFCQRLDRRDQEAGVTVVPPYNAAA